MKKEDMKKEDDDYGTLDYCTCETHYYDEHPCPFKSEIDGDDESMCNCCPYCEQNCADDI